MRDIIQDIWTAVDECTLLAEQATSSGMRNFYQNLANSWRTVALNYEALEKNDSTIEKLA